MPLIIQNDRLFDFAVSRSAGGLSPRVKWEHLADYEFDLPSIEEQRILADKLWAAYELKEAYKKMIAATDEMVKSQFIEMLYTAEKRLPLSAICSYIGKGITPKYVDNSTVGVVNQACVHWTGQRLESIKYHNPNISIKKREIQTGDVLLNATGNGTLGRSCVFMHPVDGKTYINDGHVIALSTDKNIIYPEVLNAYFSLPDTQGEIYRQYVTGSTNQIDIVFAEFKKMQIPLPDISAQSRFKNMLKQADKSKFELQQAIEKIDKVMKSLLQ